MRPVARRCWTTAWPPPAGWTATAPTSGRATVARRYSAKPYVYDPVPRRDERFQDLCNQGVNAEAFLYDPTFPPQPKALMMLFKRLREIDVPEMMASIIHRDARASRGATTAT